MSPLETQTNILPFLSACTAIAPTFMSLGNHEWMVDQEDLAAITATGVTLLDNRWIERNGLVIGGLTSGYVTDYRRFKATQTTELRYPRREDIAGIAIRVGQNIKNNRYSNQWIAKLNDLFNQLLVYGFNINDLVPLIFYENIRTLYKFGYKKTYNDYRNCPNANNVEWNVSSIL